ncbi:MAG: PLP-dependent aminotransferase family protein [Sphingomonadales bacterium]
MRLQSPWTPYLAPLDAPVSERLVKALADDILEGRLETGARLPAHRDIAWKLGIGVGTVTKAYAVLDRRGLTRSVKGRGTFVATRQAHQGPIIDMSINAPPTMLSERLLARTLSDMAKRVDPHLFALYPPPAGHMEHRRLMARWLETIGMAADPAHIVLTSGAQQALWLVFSLLCSRGETLYTERITYPGAISLAKYAGYRLRGVDIDGEGIVPAALDMALAEGRKREEVGAVYLTPTMHNPTTSTMGLARRRAVAEVCRRHDVPIIEDDVYAFAADVRLPPLAMLAPERTFYVNSLAKTLSPGLRIGALVVPPTFLDRAEAALRAASSMASPLSCALMEAWLTSGAAASVRASIRMEATRRRAIAASFLGGAMAQPSHDGFHVWMPMPRDEADQFVRGAAGLGIMLTQPDTLSVDPNDLVSGVRICLGGPSLSELTRGLEALASLHAYSSASSASPSAPIV